MNYPDSVHFLYALGNEIKTAKLGLERIGAVLDALGRPQDRCRIVHVAGTNGKGSICAMLESGLRAAGLRTGLYTSPHLMEPTERIRINGEPVSAAAFAAAFDRVHEAVERLLEAGAIDLHTTYFETVTAMAFLIFAEAGVDVVALEVGLGGRLDATNVVRPELCVIAPIDFDHESYLGRSLEAIAGEKAGILKAGVPAVFSRQRAEVRPVLEARAREVGAKVTWTADLDVSGVEVDARGSWFGLRGQPFRAAAGVLPGARRRPEDRRDEARRQPRRADPTDSTLRIHCPLAGEHQVENAVTAAGALLRLGIPASAIERGIAATRWPGRLERVSERPEIILDGAHNPAGARALAAYIDRFYGGRNVRLIYGAMRDKAVAEMGGILFPHAREVIVTAPREARAMAPETLIGIAEHANARVAANIEEALAAVSGAPEEVVIFITGSLFLVAEARAMLGRDHLL